MEFEKMIRVSDLIAALSLLFAIIGGIFAYYQWRKSVLFKRAAYINELTEKTRTDTDIQETIYLFDYGEKWYSENFHESGKLERKIDKTLAYFSYISYLKKHHLITRSDFAFFQYEIERILVNCDVQDYFYNLYHFSKKFKLALSFYYLFNYGKKKKKYDSDFFDCNSYKTLEKYHHYLNF